MAALATQKGPRRPPRTLFFDVAHRIAGSFSKKVASAYLDEVGRVQKRADQAAIRAALVSGRSAAVERAMGLETMGLGAETKIEHNLIRIAQATGEASASSLSAAGIEVSFNATHPRVVLWAREHAASLVVGIGETARETIRLVVSEGFRLGLTVDQQARIIREVVGLPPNWANAPINLGEEIRQGLEAAATDRRLSGVDIARIKNAIRTGTNTDESFIAEMQDHYSKSLVNLRARMIARTETLRVANHGMLESWNQAISNGELPADTRKVIVVTPDDRLRETHAAVAEEYADGIPVDEMFDTEWGALEGPPWETACRCGMGLIFPGRGGTA